LIGHDYPAGELRKRAQKSQTHVRQP